MPRSVAQFINDLKVALRDTAGSNNIWTRREYVQSLREAQQSAKGAFWWEDVYTSITVRPTVHVYSLPGYIQHINRIERAVSGPINTANASGDIRYETIFDWRQIAGYQTNQLWVGGNFPDSRTRIYFERDIPIFPIEETFTTSMNATGTVIPFINSGSPMYLWPVPGLVQIGNEIMFYDSVALTGFFNVQRGQYGTGPATATNPFGLVQNSETLVSGVWSQDYHESDIYVMEKAKEKLMLMRLMDGDIEGSRTIASLATQFGQSAKEHAMSDRMRHEGRTFTQKRRPRI